MNIIDIRDDLPVNQARIDAGGEIPKRTGKIKRIVVHCTDDDDKEGEDVYEIAEYDINPNHISKRGCYTITYTYYIEHVDGEVKIYQCVDHDIVTWHVGVWNDDPLGIVVDKLPDDAAPEKRAAAIALCAQLCEDLGLTYKDVVFHRELQYTGWNWNEDKTEKLYRKSCPGWAWNVEEFRADVSTAILVTAHRARL